MSTDKQMSITISLPQSAVLELRKMAAERMLEDPSRAHTVAQIARQMILDQMKNPTE